MPRSMRWYWAGAISFVTFYVTLLSWEWLCLRGSLADTNDAPLEPLYRQCYQAVRKTLGRGFGACFVAAWFDAPGLLAAVGTYELLCRPARPRPLRCLKCGWVLLGLTEPRCPKCGEPI